MAAAPAVALLLTFGVLAATFANDDGQRLRVSDGRTAGGDDGVSPDSDADGNGDDSNPSSRDAGSVNDGNQRGSTERRGRAGTADGEPSNSPSGGSGAPPTPGTSSKGVFPTEIRLGVVAGPAVPEGRLASSFQAADSDETHDLKVWQDYFNRSGSYNGRRVQFYVLHQTGGEDQQRASVARADQEFQVFAIIGNGDAASYESVRNKIVDFSEVARPLDFFGDSYPYAFSVEMDTTQIRYLAAELMCKQFVGRPPGELNERRDPTFDYNAARRFGLVTEADSPGVRGGLSSRLGDALRSCGAEFAVAETFASSDPGTTKIAGTMAKMKASGVTTVVLDTSALYPGVLSAEADQIAYYPEYIAIGGHGLETAEAGRLMTDEQAKHMVGINPRDLGDHADDWYGAYKEVDPEGEPSSKHFRVLQHLTAGLRRAGATVTPETFWTGLTRAAIRERPSPSATGAYRERFASGPLAQHRDLTYYDNVTLMWWDNVVADPDSTLAGAWRHVWKGRRFGLGAVPSERVPWFTDGTTYRSR